MPTSTRFTARAQEIAKRVTREASPSSDRAAVASVRRVLTTLIAGALVALFTLGFGIYAARERSAETLTTASVDHWTAFLANIIAQSADRGEQNAIAAGQAAAQPVLDSLNREKISFIKYRIATPQGLIVAATDPTEIGHQLSARTVAMATNGLYYDKEDGDDVTGVRLPSGYLTAYRPIELRDGQTIGLVGITTSRHAYANSLYDPIWVGYGLVILMTFLFGGTGAEFLRRHLVARHALQAWLVNTMVDLELAENVAHIGYWSIDAKTSHVTWSDQMFELFRVNPETFRPTRNYVSNLVLPEYRDSTLAEFKRIEDTNGAGEIETRILRADGIKRDVMVAMRSQTSPDGDVVRYFGIVSDITERKATQRALEVREQELAQAIAATEAAVWTWEIGENIFRASPQLMRILGAESDSAKEYTLNHKEICHPDDLELVLTALRAHYIEGSPYDAEYRVRHTNGSYVWIHSRGQVVEWSRGRPVRMVGTIIDITRRRVAEDGLRQSQRTLSLALRAAEAGYYTANVKDEEIYWSPRFQEILGITGACPPSAELFISLIHPDDQALFQGLRDTRDENRAHEFELRVRHASGRYIWLHIRAVTELETADELRRTIGFVQDVTARHEAIEALAVSEERFRLLTENSSDVIALLEEDGVVSYISPSVYRVAGYSPEDFIGNTGMDSVYPDDREFVAVRYANMIARGEPRESQQRYRIIRKDGSMAWIESRVVIIPNKNGRYQILSSGRDISDNVAAEAALKDSESRFRLLANNAVDVIAVTDETGIIQYVSPSVERLIGFKPEEIMGRIAFRHVAAIDTGTGNFSHNPEDFTKLYGAGTHRSQFRHKDGHLIWVETTVQRIPKPDGSYEIQGASRDITDRVEYEAELRATRDRFQKQATELATLAQNLELERERAEKANKAKSQFLAMMSHELRTPMTGILGMADLILLSNLTAEQNSIMQRLVRSARILLDLLNDILDFSKIEAVQLQIDNISFHISDVVADIEALFAPQASEKGVTLSVALPPELQDAFIGDAKRLRQILVNLIGNAIKFTEKGFVAVTVSQEAVSDGRTMLRIEVTDSGIGISPDQIKRLFQPFVQADASTSRKYGGTGLGLAITRRLVEAMGGTISVSSELGRGSTFSFTAYLQPDPHAMPRRPTPRRRPRRTPVPPAPQAGQGRRVLVAEDNETTRFLVTTMLGKWGYKVDTAENGQQALAAVASHVYDIVLMDIQMPVMDGSEAIEIIRAREKGTNRRLPIIALTADLVGSHRRHFMALGADAIVPKPVNWETLTVEMNRLIEPTPTKTDTPDMPVYGAPSSPIVLNTDTLAELREVLGDAALDTMIARFLESSDKYRIEVEENLKTNKLREAKRAAHALKGLCAQFGAMKIAAVAKSIEEHTTTVDESRALLPQLAISSTETRAALAAYFAKMPNPVS